MGAVLCLLILSLYPRTALSKVIFESEKFTLHDAVLVSDQSGNILYQWQSEQLLIPASLTKLVTAYLALDKWGGSHRFSTEFYLRDKQLWVKGYGDPYLISEELNTIASALHKALITNIESVHIDASYFMREQMPGRSRVADPYNAPLSAVAANFNTVTLQTTDGSLLSAEPQTPLTNVAKQLARRAGIRIGRDATRINLLDGDLAQRHFAELLLNKMGLKLTQISINQTLPSAAKLIYRHQNSHNLSDILRAALKYSNNFVANQIFLLLGQSSAVEQMRFASSSEYARQRLANNLAWRSASIIDGSGLSRDNKVTARQLNQILHMLRPNKSLLKQYPLRACPMPAPNDAEIDAQAFAKTGTLDGVHSFAGFLEVATQQFQFVFIFNRKMPYRHRERLLQDLVDQLCQSSVALQTD